MIYLASPYSHQDRHVRWMRFDTICRHAAMFIRNGFRVISPIAHSYPIAKYELPDSFAFWEGFNLELLDMCESMIVVKMPGWETSKGVLAEIEHAKRTGKAVVYLDENDVEAYVG